MIIFGNIGFMGFPVITAIFGSKGLVYAVIMNIVFNLLVFSYGIKLITDGNEGAGKFSLRKLLNMPLASSVLALLLFFLQIAGSSQQRALHYGRRHHPNGYAGFGLRHCRNAPAGAFRRMAGLHLCGPEAAGYAAAGFRPAALTTRLRRKFSAG